MQLSQCICFVKLQPFEIGSHVIDSDIVVCSLHTFRMGALPVLQSQVLLASYVFLCMTSHELISHVPKQYTGLCIHRKFFCN